MHTCESQQRPMSKNKIKWMNTQIEEMFLSDEMAEK